MPYNCLKFTEKIAFLYKRGEKVVSNNSYRKQRSLDNMINLELK